MNFRRIFEGVADHGTCFDLLNRHSGGGLKPDSLWAGEWWEIEFESFYYFLDVLPPLRMPPGGFIMCEFTSGNVTSAFFAFPGPEGGNEDRFFHASLDMSVATAFAKARAEIASAIRKRIES